MKNIQITYNLPDAKCKEAQRRFRLLGDLIEHPDDIDALIKRARAVLVRPQRLKTWLCDFQRDGLVGLEPNDWTELTTEEQEIASAHYAQLQPYCDTPDLSTTDIANLAEQLGYSFRRTKQWLERYANGGLWGLTARFNPEQSKAERVSRTQEPPDLATLNESDLEMILKRLQMLGPLADDRPVSDAEVAARAAEVGVSPRTLRDYRSRKRKHGLAGLAPRTRSDHGKTHNLSERMEALVRSIGISYSDWPIHHIHATAVQKAGELGEVPPSVWQVRNIIRTIPDPIKLLASRRDREFKNLYRQTFPIHFEGTVYQIDHTPIDVLVIDKRGKKFRTASGEIRPTLTTVMDSRSRYIVAFHLGYDRPDKHVVKAVIRASVLANPGGIPNQIWIDNGKDLVAHEVRILTQELGIELNILAPQQPQQKGIVERFFGTLNTRLWATLPGYVGSDTNVRNPTTSATLTIQDVHRLLSEFLELYHNEVHTSIDMSPLEFWRQHCFAMPVGDIHLLDALMLSTEQRRIEKTGIRFDNRIYVHAELGVHVGKTALIRADTVFGAPDQIEVYVEDHHVCTAFALDSERGRALSREEQAEYIRGQKNRLRQPIAEARELLESTDEAIAEAKRLKAQAPPLQSGDTCEIQTEDAIDSSKPTIPVNEESPHLVKSQKSKTKELDLLDLEWEQMKSPERKSDE